MKKYISLLVATAMLVMAVPTAAFAGYSSFSSSRSFSSSSFRSSSFSSSRSFSTPKSYSTGKSWSFRSTPKVNTSPKTFKAQPAKPTLKSVKPYLFKNKQGVKPSYTYKPRVSTPRTYVQQPRYMDYSVWHPFHWWFLWWFLFTDHDSK